MNCTFELTTWWFLEPRDLIPALSMSVIASYGQKRTWCLIRHSDWSTAPLELRWNRTLIIGCKPPSGRVGCAAQLRVWVWARLPLVSPNLSMNVEAQPGNKQTNRATQQCFRKTILSLGRRECVGYDQPQVALSDLSGIPVSVARRS
jgi:hypothetical protein